MANVKCPYCEQQDNKDNMIKIGRRYWHHTCREEYLINEEKQKTEQEKNQKRDAEEYKELIQYVCELFNTTKPSGIILKQIQEYHKEPYGYRYKAIKMALEYFFDIKNNSTEKARGIGILPYIYDEAVEFYYDLVRINSTEEIESEDVKEVTIKRPTKNINKKKKKFDLNNL